MGEGRGDGRDSGRVIVVKVRPLRQGVMGTSAREGGKGEGRSRTFSRREG